MQLGGGSGLFCNKDGEVFVFIFLATVLSYNCKVSGGLIIFHFACF